MLAQIRPALVLTLIMTLLLGVAYPLAITGVAALAFPAQAQGSAVSRDGVVVGSSLIGQNFTAPQYFHPRPSATGPEPYNGAASTGSNYGPTSAALIERTAGSVAALDAEGPVPADAVTASGSGLDPDISPAFAAMQVGRVAQARGMEAAAVEAIVAQVTEGPMLGIFGEPRVNVLALNMALDAAAN